jgi:uncharacterized protein (DUF983 family)
LKDFIQTLRKSLACRCPKCHQGHLYQSTFDLRLHDTCPHCGLDLAKNDSADGPAVFLIFILGFALVPLALLVDHYFHLPLWAHGVVWTIVTLGLTIGALKPLKSYVIALQYKYRKSDWKEE